MKISNFLRKKNADIPADIADKLGSAANITLTAFEEKNDVLSNESLRSEAGYVRMPNGDYLVSMFCPMPGVTKEMIDWWFWWHPQADERYQLWFPGEHFKIRYAKKNTGYFSSLRQPGFQPNTQYPTEMIGNIKMPLQIDFISAADFGFDPSSLERNHVATVICGHVGAFHNLIPHTEMAHIFFQTPNGLYMVSRFWIGKRLRNPMIRRMILKSETAEGMAKHCCVEYRNLAMKLPELYSTYHHD